MKIEEFKTSTKEKNDPEDFEKKMISQNKKILSA